MSKEMSLQQRVQGDRAGLKLGAFTVGINGLAVEGVPDIPTCTQVGKVLGTVKQSMQMAIGGFINWLEAHYGEQASQIVDTEIFGDDRTVLVWRWVEEKVPLVNRRLAEISFSHHQVVAVLEPAQQVMWLQKAIDGKWSVAELKAAMKEAAAVPDSKAGRPPTFWVEVQCEDEDDQHTLMGQLQEQGRTCRAK